MRILMFALSIVAASTLAGAASAQVPPAIAAPGENAVVTLHAEGAQVYECKAGSDGKLAGLLSGVTTVQRINTRGGVHAGACDQAGALHSAPYSADYVFLKKGS